MDARRGAAALSSVIVLVLLASSAVLLPLAFDLAPPPPPSASVVIGQEDFYSSDQGVGPANLSYPQYVAVDHSGDLWVSDSQNGWVTEYPSPFSNFENATVEIGGLNFSMPECSEGATLCQPTGMAFDSGGNLWVADNKYGSVQEFTAPLVTGGSPSAEIGGQVASAGANRTVIGAPQGIAFDSSGNLWVVDSAFNRILEFTPPFARGMAASLVIGEPNFTSAFDPSLQSRLSYPAGIAFDGRGDIWVGDEFDNRVLEFTPPFSNGESATLVLGQPNFESTSENTTQSTMALPAGLAFDSHGNLWVADLGNNRIMEFVPTFSTGMGANILIGQNSYFSPDLGTDPSSLYHPNDVAVGPSEDIWVADTENARVLLFVVPPGELTATTSQTLSSSQSQSVGSQSLSTSTSGSSTTTTVSSSSSQGQNIPEFPYQSAAIVIFVLILTVGFILARRRDKV